jgi:hypothetical protein
MEDQLHCTLGRLVRKFLMAKGGQIRNKLKKLLHKYLNGLDKVLRCIMNPKNTNNDTIKIEQ